MMCLSADIVHQPPTKKLRLDEVLIALTQSGLSAEQQDAIANAAADFVQQQIVNVTAGASAMPTDAAEAHPAPAHTVEDPFLPTAVFWSDAVPEHVRQDIFGWLDSNAYGVSQIVQTVEGDGVTRMRSWAADNGMQIGTYRKYAAHKDSVNKVIKGFHVTNGSNVVSSRAIGINMDAEIDAISQKTTPLVNAYAYADNDAAAVEGRPVAIRAIEFAQSNTPQLECSDSRFVIPNARLHYTFVRVAYDLFFVFPVLLALDQTGQVEVLVDKSARRISQPVNVHSNTPMDAGAIPLFHGVTHRLNFEGKKTPQGLLFRHKAYKSTPALVGSRASGIINTYLGAGFEATPQDVGDGKYGAWVWTRNDGLEGKATKGSTMAPIPFAVFLAHYFIYEIAHKQSFAPGVMSPTFLVNATGAWANLNLTYEQEGQVVDSVSEDNYPGTVYNKAVQLASSVFIVDADKDAAANWTFSRSDVSSDVAIANSRRVLPNQVIVAEQPPQEEEEQQQQQQQQHEFGGVSFKMVTETTVTATAGMTTPRCATHAQEREAMFTFTNRSRVEMHVFESPSQPPPHFLQEPFVVPDFPPM